MLKQISAVLSGSQTTQQTGYNHTPSEVAAFMYAPLVSADVERSFSRYKAFLPDNRQSFTIDNIRKHMIIQCDDVSNHA